jgi:hypothetical protein
MESLRNQFIGPSKKMNDTTIVAQNQVKDGSLPANQEQFRSPTPGTLDAGQPGSDPVGDGELRFEGFSHSITQLLDPSRLFFSSPRR